MQVSETKDCSCGHYKYSHEFGRGKCLYKGCYCDAYNYSPDWKIKMNIFNCKCGNLAKWLVWYKDCGNLYNYRCTECANKDMLQLSLGTDAYPVTAIRSMDSAIYADKQGWKLNPTPDKNKDGELDASKT